MRHAGYKVDTKLRELLLPPELVDCRRNEPCRKREQAYENRKPGAWQSSNDELRRDIRPKRHRQAHAAETLVECIDHSEIAREFLTARAVDGSRVRRPHSDRDD